MVVGGDIAPESGHLIALRRAHNEGAWLWNRRGSESVEEALTRKGSCDLKLADEPQGEAIAFSARSYGIYTTSEGQNEPIYYYDFFLS